MSYDDLFNSWLRNETEPAERPYLAMVGPLTPFPDRTLADAVRDGRPRPQRALGSAGMRTEHDLTAVVVPLAELRHHPENARTHDLETLKASLRAHGQFAPVVVQKSSGYVIKGNGTMDAAAELGWEALTVVTLDVDDDQARRILLIDNRSSDNGGYVEESLTALLQALGDDLTGTGYDEGDLDARLAQLAINDTQGRSSVDERDGWDNKDARTILLTYTVAEHRELCEKLDVLCEQLGVDTYSDVARHLIENAFPDAPG